MGSFRALVCKPEKYLDAIVNAMKETRKISRARLKGDNYYDKAIKNDLSETETFELRCGLS